MHRALCIPEILLHVFGHCCQEPPATVSGNYNPDLLALARTCQKFKEPALDVLWEKLYDLSPLVRCVPQACFLAEPAEKSFRPNRRWYLFSRPLKEAEWDTLRGYSRRVRIIHGSFEPLHEDLLREIFLLAPPDNPLFPSLRSLYWNGADTIAPLHVAVPSLTFLHLDLHRLLIPALKEFLDAFGDRCENMEGLVVDHLSSNPVDSAISCLVRRWPKLRVVVCSNVALNVDAITHLSSAGNLYWLEFTTEVGVIQDISRLKSKLAFPNLTTLDIMSTLLDTVTSFLHSTRLPAVESLRVTIHWYIPRRAIQAYWAAVQEACLSDVLAYLSLSSYMRDEEVPLDEEVLPCLRMDDLRPCTVFSELRGLDLDLVLCPVGLTDADLLELVTPRMEYFLVNYNQGWHIDVDGGGITLSGFVRLLQQCPSLNRLCLAIDTRTFTEIPEGLDVSFPVRRWVEIDFADSYILPEFVPDVASMFSVLKLNNFKFWSMYDWDCDGREGLTPLWDRVLDELRTRELCLPATL